MNNSKLKTQNSKLPVSYSASRGGQRKTKKFFSKSKIETWKLAGKVFRELSGIKEDKAAVLALKGELGAGKTTFAQGILKAAGARGPFTSPTFVIMKRYGLRNKKQVIRNKQNSKFNPEYSGQNSKFISIYHFDCYRVGSKDILDLGWEEIISKPENLVLVEWPEKIKDILPTNHILIEFKTKGEGEGRLLKILKR